MFNVRPDLHWLGFRSEPSNEQEVPGFRFKPHEEEVPGFRVKPPEERVPGFRMNADGSIREAAAPAARRYPGLGGNPFNFFDQPGPDANAFTPVADKPPWGGWGMSPYPEDNDNEPPNKSRTPVCGRANFLCQQFGRGATPERYAPWVYECSNSYGLCQNYERDPNRIGRLGDRIEFPDGSAVIFRRGYPPVYVPSPRL
ncbi:MAG: hypothetical protein GEV13_08690 [Rhodospirillales bacterium]|nr:hypothetical protein [Rhodospirillales bacterium]